VTVGDFRIGFAGQLLVAVELSTVADFVDQSDVIRLAWSAANRASRAATSASVGAVEEIAGDTL
jgi:hypothetical protein